MRTFIAVDIPDDAKMALDKLCIGFRRSGCRISWVKAKNLHLTVKFIGDFDPESIPELTAALKETVKGHGKQLVSLQGLGGFPNTRKPRVLWVGAEQGREWFVELARKIDKACAKLGVKKEKKKPSPHLTIGRVRDLHDWHKLEESFNTASFEYPAFEVDSITIYKSDLSPRGAEYSVIEKIPLD
ncbi:MAG: RNA 2',3'-cyclic phosphodiesterase [candidate division Zixibacteria bacterium]|nr:RNA 2',3'-cyclic phosphodiesterase [candidate division Zixibacteria bacterium]